MRRALLLIVAALTLAACKVDATVHITMRPDGGGSIALTVVADQQVVQQAPGLAADLKFDDATAAGWQVDGPTDTADGGVEVTLTHDFTTAEEATALLRSLNGNGGPLHDVAITRTVTTQKLTTALTGALRVEGGVDAFADPDVLAAIGGSPYADNIAATGLGPNDVITFTITADLPGEATTPGVGTKATGGGLTFTVPMDGTTVDLGSVFTQQQGRPSTGWGLIAKIAFGLLIAWLVLAAAFILFVANARRKRAMRRPNYR
ncbi:MAG: hypothetical protein F2681_07185 [Actinobacteria bacterium]|uniref:Unannotated protein n=1 Tax=freshwater metagenome TaxID=449393 RepID=A0A6J7NSM4_9ZZZZ|nr:hypothetical protein [Actinomycetota bacterium]MSW77003.1 hypothetical protein [Actinomycetota bacterium]MSX55793.1 hypothetical protein [Actinomycetota bacterium]MSX92153.1 hypothetical protein [Actinomycetota bacterium]MSZ82909.1 hypothetical protein [Actinomycetota bacterium]